MYKMQQTNIKYSAVYPNIIPDRKKKTSFIKTMLGHEGVIKCLHHTRTQQRCEQQDSSVVEFQLNAKFVRKALPVWE